MKRIPPDLANKKQDLANDLQTALEALQGTITAGNEQIEMVRDALEQSQARVNEVIAEANQLIEEVQIEQEGHLDKHDEAWQSGDIGAAYQDWMSAWENCVDDVEVVPPDVVEDLECDLDLAQILRDLPDRP